VQVCYACRVLKPLQRAVQRPARGVEFAVRPTAQGLLDQLDGAPDSRQHVSGQRRVERAAHRAQVGGAGDGVHGLLGGMHQAATGQRAVEHLKGDMGTRAVVAGLRGIAPELCLVQVISLQGERPAQYIMQVQRAPAGAAALLDVSDQAAPHRPQVERRVGHLLGESLALVLFVAQQHGQRLALNFVGALGLLQVAFAQPAVEQLAQAAQPVSGQALTLCLGEVVGGTTGVGCGQSIAAIPGAPPGDQHVGKRLVGAELLHKGDIRQTIGQVAEPGGDVLVDGAHVVGGLAQQERGRAATAQRQIVDDSDPTFAGGADGARRVVQCRFRQVVEVRAQELLHIGEPGGEVCPVRAGAGLA